MRYLVRNQELSFYTTFCCTLNSALGYNFYGSYYNANSYLLFTEAVVLTTLDVPEALLEEIDLIVAQRKAAKSEPYNSTPEQRMEAVRLAEEQGVSAANAYLRALRPASKVSRSAVILDCLRGLERLPSAAKEPFVKAAKPTASQPAASKFGPGTKPKKSAK